jgi:ubiquinone/menaquinone biosynthesis C-methylase UbiE
LSRNCINDPGFLRGNQYRDSDNLRARIELHTRFSTNNANWFPWLFDRLNFPPCARVLEIGCGPGDLWKNNLERIRPGWQLTLSDLSEGMVMTARQNLDRGSIRFCCVDADDFPFPADSFDAVVGNHMLYHVPDKDHTLGEVCRTLSQDGILITATNGASHLAELFDLLEGFDPDYQRIENMISFTLENGTELLEKYFHHVERFDFPNDLHITEVEPLVAYTLSLWSINQEYFRARLDEYRAYLKHIMDRNGVIKINKSVGVFVSQGIKRV